MASDARNESLSRPAIRQFVLCHRHAACATVGFPITHRRASAWPSIRHALLKNLLPRFGVNARFVDLCNHDAVRAAMTPRTRVLYCESLSNPLLEVSDLPALAAIAHESGARLVVDNTFTPMILSPLRHGADVVVHSLTKFVNGTSDCVAGCVVSSRDFIAQLNDINSGPSMLLGPVLDSTRAASILKNLHSLHVRLRQHGANALHLARRLEALGYPVHYPCLLYTSRCV